MRNFLTLLLCGFFFLAVAGCEGKKPEEKAVKEKAAKEKVDAEKAAAEKPAE